MTQRQLAARSGVDQAVIARIEAGVTDPRVGTIVRLLDGCKMDLEAIERRGSGVDRGQIRQALALTDADREQWFFRSNANILRLFRHAREVQ